MASTKPKASAAKAKAQGMRGGPRLLGIRAASTVQIIHQIRVGFPFSRLARFQKVTQLPWEKVAGFVAIPQRTLTRRQSEGRLQADESDRVLRAARVFEMAIDLFEGDVAAARQWLQTPQPALGGEVPLEFAATGVGAREVENLIGRLEHGVVA